ADQRLALLEAADAQPLLIGGAAAEAAVVGGIGFLQAFHRRCHPGAPKRAKDLKLLQARWRSFAVYAARDDFMCKAPHSVFAYSTTSGKKSRKRPSSSTRETVRWRVAFSSCTGRERRREMLRSAMWMPSRSR